MMNTVSVPARGQRCRTAAVTCLALLLVAFQGTALAATPVIEEITRLDGTSVFAIHELKETSAGTFFAATDGVHGRELWISDGTTAGTRLVKDIVPGTVGSSAEELVVLNDTLYFVVTIGASDDQLWKSDGTEAGTQRVVLDQVGFTSLTVFNGALYFQAGSPIGTGLWRSDGTPEGTERMIEMVGRNHTVSGSYLFFTGSDSTYGSQLFRTDGTVAGTIRLTNIGATGYNLDAHALTDVNGTLFFLAEHTTTNTAGVYKSDGSVAGTVKITGTMSPYRLSYGAAVNGKYVFSSAPTGDENGNVELYVSNGTAAGTVLLKDIRSGLAGSYPADFVSDGTRVYFRATTDTYGGEVWTSDGTAAGTIMLTDASPGLSTSYRERSLVLSGSRAYFVARTLNNQDYELWTSTGTTVSTMRVKDIGPGTTSGLPATNDILHPVSGGGVWFAGFDGSERALWTSDGSEANTAMLRPAFGHVASLYPSPRLPVVAGGRTFFVGNDYAYGRELWATDGTGAGTTLLADTRAGLAAGFTSFIGLAGDKAIFSANDDGVNGIEPWVSDGTPVGTQLLLDIRAGATSSDVYEPGVSLNGELLFVATDDTGRELWKTDGTSAGTARLADIYPGPSSSGPANFLAVDGKAYFVAGDGVTGVELWVTDGTEAGTRHVSDVPAGSSGGVDRYIPLAALGSRILFVAYSTVEGVEPWISDGTEAGSYMLADVAPGAASSSVMTFTVAGSQAFFAAANSVSGRELWVTDGSVENTRMVIDLAAGASYGVNSIVGAIDNDVIFLAAGQRLYRSDGSAAGTYPLTPVGVTARDPVITSQGIFFIGGDVTDGFELWLSDGVTEEGATRLSTFTAGTADPRIAYKGMPDNPGFVAVPGGVLFHVISADDGTGIHFSNGTIAGTERLSLAGKNTFVLQAINANNPALAIVNDEGGGALWKMTFNTPPVVGTPIADSNGTQNEAFEYDVSPHFSDAEGGAITYNADGLPDGLTIDSATGVISGLLTNDAAMASPVTVTVTATDAAGDSVSTTFNIAVANINDAPQPVDDTAVTDEDTAIVIDVLANDSDPDGDAFTVTEIVHDPLVVTTTAAAIEILPGGTSIKVTPFLDGTAPIEFTYRISDGELTADADVVVSITPVNDAPRIMYVVATQIVMDVPFELVVDVLDPENDAVTLSAPSLPEWLSFDAASGELTGTPGKEHLGEHEVRLLASDGVAEREQAFTLTVIEPPDADLSVTATLDTSDPQAETPFDWTLRVANAGPDGVNDATVTVSGSATLNIVSVGEAGECVADGAGWHCTLPVIDAGDEISLSVRTQAAAGSHTLSANVTSSASTDPVSENNTMASTVTVLAADSGSGDDGGNSDGEGGGGGAVAWLLLLGIAGRRTRLHASRKK